MDKSLKEMQKSLFSAEFKNFCKKSLSKNMAELEKIRLQSLNTIRSIVTVDIVLAIVCFIGVLGFEGEKIQPLLIVAPIVIIFCSIYYVLKTFRNFKKQAKSMVLVKLLSYLGDFHFERPDNRNYIEDLELFPYFNRFHCDDRIVGMYNLLNVDISEISLKHETRSGKHSHVETIFNGIFIKVPCNKRFEGATVIRGNYSIDWKLPKVHLEDPEFENLFDVFSTDQIEARYLITTAFMNRLVQLAKKGLCSYMTMSFEEGFVNIAVPSSKDWFNVSINKPATNIENYRAIILELITILKIIDALKLDMNIGL